jgi:hypothetical protein
MALPDALNIHNIRQRLRTYAQEKGHSELERLLKIPASDGNAEEIAKAIAEVPDVGEALRAALVGFPHVDEIVTAVVSNPNNNERVNVIAIGGYTIFCSVSDYADKQEIVIDAVRAIARIGVTYQGIVDRVMPIIENDLTKKDEYTPFSILRKAEVLELPKVVTLLRGLQEGDEFEKVLFAVVYEVGMGLNTPATTEKVAKYLQQLHGTELEYSAECIRTTYRQRQSAPAVNHLVDALGDESFIRMKQRYAQHPEAFTAMMDIVEARMNKYSYEAWRNSKPITRKGYVTEVRHIARIFEDNSVYRVMTEVSERKRIRVYQQIKEAVMKDAESVINGTHYGGRNLEKRKIVLQIAVLKNQ